VAHLNHHCRDLYVPAQLDVATYSLAIINDGEPLRAVRGEAHKLLEDVSLACNYKEEDAKAAAATVFGNLVQQMTAPEDATNWTKKYGADPLAPYQYSRLKGQQSTM